jgi:DNA-binding response OmpR family regulator
MSAVRKEKILLIEDDIALRSIYADVIAADGYTVVTAEDGEQGLAMVKMEKPDLVVLDIILPKLPGFEVLKSIRADAGTRDTIVLILSVMGEQRHIKKAMDLGADDYTVKGSHIPNDILGKIQALFTKATVKEQAKKQAKEQAEKQAKEHVKVYNLSVRGDRADALALERDTGATKMLICKACGEERLLVLTPDPSHSDAHWFSAYFACPKCGKAF